MSFRVTVGRWQKTRAVLAFTTQGLFSEFKDLHLTPVATLNTSKLKLHFDFVLGQLCNYVLGRAVSVDNHISNRNLYPATLWRNSFDIDKESYIPREHLFALPTRHKI